MSSYLSIACEDAALGHSLPICCGRVIWRFALEIDHQLRRTFVPLNRSWVSGVRFGPFSSTCRLEEAESLADSRPRMFAARALTAPCSRARKPLPGALLAA